MKRIFYATKMLLVAAGLTASANAYATTYTAVASGDFSASSTWQGGTAPGNNLTNDEIIIGAGFTVNLDMDVTFDQNLLGTATFTVQGTLDSDNNSDLIMNGGDLAGNGTISIDVLEFNNLSTMSFTGQANVNEFNSNSIALALDVYAETTVLDTLTLSAGVLTLGNGSDFQMATDAVIKVNGGSIALNGGLMTATNDYDVLYVGSSATTGLELSGTGMRNLHINLDDDNQTVALGSDLVVSGDVMQESGSLSMNGFDLTLMGDYDNSSSTGISGSATSSLMIMSSSSTTSGLMFNSGSEDLDTLMIATSNDSQIDLMSDLNIHGGLRLDSSSLNLMNGITLTMENNSTVIVNQGMMTVSNGTFEGSNSYNVMYEGEGGMTSGIELSGSGLNELTLMLDDSDDQITLDSDLNSNGSLNLENGTLVLSDNNLTLSGDFSSSEDGMIYSTTGSNININTAISLADTLMFAENGNQVNQLNVDITSGGDVVIGNNAIFQEINFTNGHVVITDNTIILASGGSFSGADEDNYVMINGSGSLMMEVESGNTSGTMFPVGTSTSYAPAVIELNSGSTGNFGVNTMDGVMDAGTFGTDLALTESVVNRTWNVSSENGSETDIDLTLMWSQSMEVNGFDRTDARISHYTDGNWDSYAYGSATTNANGMFQLTRQDISSLSPFAINDSESTLAVEETPEVIAGVYPNPAINSVNVDLANDGATTIELLDASGRVVATHAVNGTTSFNLDITSIAPGAFYIRAIGTDNVSTIKVIKATK